MGELSVSSFDNSSGAEQVAARLAAITDVHDIRLMKSSAEIFRLPVANPVLTYELNTDATVEYEPGSESFVVRGTYRVTIATTPADDDGSPSYKNSDAAVARIEFEQAGLFVMDMDGSEPPKAEELEAYAASTGQYALYPYVREYISDVTMRLGLPPLTVGLLKVPFDSGSIGDRQPDGLRLAKQ
jgi:Preprotein translocase subunit SecB